MIAPELGPNDEFQAALKVLRGLVLARLTEAMSPLEEGAAPSAAMIVAAARFLKEHGASEFAGAPSGAPRGAAGPGVQAAPTAWFDSDLDPDPDDDPASVREDSEIG